jgi:hypothetical protein
MKEEETGTVTPESTPVPEELPTHSPDGVDLTLIRWMLSLTPAQRLDALQGFVDSVWKMRNGRFTA